MSEGDRWDKAEAEIMTQKALAVPCVAHVRVASQVAAGSHGLG
jgi:hypothetical protein